MPIMQSKAVVDALFCSTQDWGSGYVLEGFSYIVGYILEIFLGKSGYTLENCCIFAGK